MINSKNKKYFNPVHFKMFFLHVALDSQLEYVFQEFKHWPARINKEAPWAHACVSHCSIYHQFRDSTFFTISLRRRASLLVTEGALMYAFVPNPSPPKGKPTFKNKNNIRNRNTQMIAEFNLVYISLLPFESKCSRSNRE